MILAADVGNTNIVLGCIEDGRIVKTVRLHTDTQKTAAEYAITLRQLFDCYFQVDCQAFEGAIVSSVVPAVTEPLRAAITDLTGVACQNVAPGMKTGLNVRIDDPGTLAADLVVGSVAAMNLYGAPVIVIDMGTATTVTVVDRGRSFRGGAIIPGVKLSFRALSAGASLLPEISITPPDKCVATNTVDCMRSGAVFGTAAMLDGLIDRMQAELGEPCAVVATGGIARFVVPYCSHEILYDDDLLLKGLWILYKKNQ